MSGAKLIETGKRGFNPLVGFCTVFIPAKGIRRDIPINARPKLRRKADLLRQTLKRAGGERAQFGAIHASLVTLVAEQPHNTSGIEATALVLHEWTQDPYFVVQGFYRDGGIGTDYIRIDADSEEAARVQIDALDISRVIDMMGLLKE